MAPGPSVALSEMPRDTLTISPLPSDRSPASHVLYRERSARLSTLLCSSLRHCSEKYLEVAALRTDAGTQDPCRRGHLAYSLQRCGVRGAHHQAHSVSPVCCALIPSGVVPRAAQVCHLEITAG
jgi:hypothetical protein